MRLIKIIPIIILLLATISYAQPQPVGIGGYIKEADGTPIVGVKVVVKNNNTNEYANTTTGSGGIYSTSLFANDGDLIVVSVTYGYTESNSVTVDLSKVTQWCNITFSSMIKADFKYNPHNPKVDELISFVDDSYSSGSMINSWEWDFDDGSTASGEHVYHLYNESGAYRVTLTIKDNKGNTDSETKTIYVRETAQKNDTFRIPPIQPPKYPEKPYTIPEMYRMIGLENQTADGKIKIAVIDTGVTPRKYSNNIDMNIDMSDILIYSIPPYNGRDDHGHGTFVNSEIHWVVEHNCPNIIQYSIKALNSSGMCTGRELEEAFDIAESLNVDIISLSLGGSGYLGDYFDNKVRELAKKGIVVVCAGGNYGPMPSTITSPGLSPSAIAVGAEDPMKTLDILGDDVIPSWSSRGPVIGLIEVKPDVVAGGESIVGPTINGEVVWSGTSMATPVIAGGVAYMMSKNYGLIRLYDILYWWDIFSSRKAKMVEKSLERSCRPLNYGSENDYGHGLPYIPDATKYLHQKLIFYIALMMIVYILIIVGIAFAVYRWRKVKY